MNAEDVAKELAELSGMVREYIRNQEKACTAFQRVVCGRQDRVEGNVSDLQKQADQNTRRIDMKLTTRGLLSSAVALFLALSILLLRYGPAVHKLLSTLDKGD